MTTSEETKADILSSAESWIENPFLSLLADAVMQAHLSEREEKLPEVKSMLARSS